MVRKYSLLTKGITAGTVHELCEKINEFSKLKEVRATQTGVNPEGMFWAVMFYTESG